MELTSLDKSGSVTCRTPGRQLPFHPVGIPERSKTDPGSQFTSRLQFILQLAKQSGQMVNIITVPGRSKCRPYLIHMPKKPKWIGQNTLGCVHNFETGIISDGKCIHGLPYTRHCNPYTKPKCYNPLHCLCLSHPITPSPHFPLNKRDRPSGRGSSHVCITPVLNTSIGA